MKNFTIMRQLEIDAAHRVPEHGSKCRALHGHRYKIEAHCRGELAQEGEQGGMLLDFSFLKEGLIMHIHDPCDHGLILRFDDALLTGLIGPTRFKDIQLQFQDGIKTWEEYSWNEGLKLYLIRTVPTAENLAQHWYERLQQFVKDRSDGRATLAKLRVHETPNCWAEYPFVVD